MISLITFTILFLFLLSNNFITKTAKEEILISNFITSLLLSISLIGIISIGLVFFELTKLPIMLIALFTALLFGFIFKIQPKNILNFLNSLKLIYNIFCAKSISNKLITFLMIWLYFISFGPLNHPDSITTYVGYPYQFFLQNKHFIDGGLHQGLLGLSDFANISFIQEKNIWFIRSIQSIPLVFLVSIFLLRKTNKLLIITFLTCPVFIQWLTIGKYLFLPDISIAITYLVWSKSKEKNSLYNLIIVILLSLSFKISCLIISLPIIVDLLCEFLKYKNFFWVLTKGTLLRICLLIFSIISLSSIFIYRLHVTGNLFYPIFNSYFVPDNQQMVNFENYLRNFMRDGNFPFNLIITGNISFLGMTLGPASGFLLISIPICKIFFSKNKSIFKVQLVAICQLVLLLTLSQGRADYFISPVILSFMGFDNPKKKLLNYPNIFYSKSYIFKLITQSMLIVQIFIFASITLISGYQTLYSIFDYESYMNRYAFNYELTNILNNKSEGKIMNIGDRTALLFLNKEYIHEDKLKKCLNTHENKNNSLSECITILKPDSIISSSDQPKIKKQFKCNKYKVNRTSRNPFNLNKRIFHICNISKT